MAPQAGLALCRREANAERRNEREDSPGEATTERSEGVGSSGWTRTSNPPVNSRTSRITTEK
jgi:hypothetical protein